MNPEIKQAIAALERGLLHCRYGTAGARDVDIAADRTAISSAIQSLRAFDAAFAERVRQDERERFAKIGRRAMLAMKRAYPHMDESAHAEYSELDDARSELQAALGRDGEHCMCEACRGGLIHASCCAVHNEPAMPNGPCDCGVLAQQVPERAE